MTQRTLIILYIWTLPILLISQTSWAQSKFFGSTQLTLATDLAQNNTISSTLKLNVGYAFSDKYKLTSQFQLNQQLNYYRESSLGNGSIVLNRNLKEILSYTNGTLAVGLVLPLNKDSRVGDELVTAVLVSPSLSHNFKYLGLPELSLNFSMAYMRNFHGHRYKKSGTINTQQSLSESLAIQYAFSKKLNFSISAGAQQSWSYNDHSNANNFSLGEEISYQLTPKLGLAMGHMLGGDLYKYNGVDLDIALFDPDRSTVYISCGYSL
ncbi:MAG: hypothetical protein ISR65_10320 [Bacteriovoracaceae bacterium]|nr:hypothetical protein [Bacteriovoracaceae bacterium]